MASLLMEYGSCRSSSYSHVSFILPNQGIDTEELPRAQKSSEEDPRATISQVGPDLVRCGGSQTSQVPKLVHAEILTDPTVAQYSIADTILIGLAD